MPLPPPVDTALGQILAAVRTAAVFAVVGFLVYAPGRYLLLPGVRGVADRAGIDPDVEEPLLKVLHASIGIVAFYFATTLSGLGGVFTATEALTAAATIALGFAAQDVLGNFVSGVFIVTDPRFNIGDWIQWDDREGIIEDISFRVTRVHTFDNELITVPNGELTQTAVVNPVAKDRLRVSQTYGIAYDADLDLAREILVAEAASLDNVVNRPPPTASVSALGDSAIEITARFWMTDPERTDFIRLRSEYNQAVLRRFDDAGIEMPYPTRAITGDIDLGGGPLEG
ncbi:MAG: mechanosensitive ion channel family protein [Halanaeroarchaeum sp.]